MNVLGGSDCTLFLEKWLWQGFLKMAVIEVTLTLCPELLHGMKCVGGIISDCSPVGFVKDIDFKFKLNTTLSIKVHVVGFVFLFVSIKVVPNPALVSVYNTVVSCEYMLYIL
jgi:hypothetical protein